MGETELSELVELLYWVVVFISASMTFSGMIFYIIYGLFKRGGIMIAQCLRSFTLVRCKALFLFCIIVAQWSSLTLYLV